MELPHLVQILAFARLSRLIRAEGSKLEQRMLAVLLEIAPPVRRYLPGQSLSAARSLQLGEIAIANCTVRARAPGFSKGEGWCFRGSQTYL